MNAEALFQYVIEHAEDEKELFSLAEMLRDYLDDQDPLFQEATTAWEEEEED
jgi:hypothetical protein